MRSPRNIASRRSARPHSSASPASSPTVSSVMRFFEKSRYRPAPSAALRIVRKQLAQVEAGDLGVVGLEGLPRAARAQRGGLRCGVGSGHGVERTPPAAVVAARPGCGEILNRRRGCDDAGREPGRDPGRFAPFFPAEVTGADFIAELIAKRHHVAERIVPEAPPRVDRRFPFLDAPENSEFLELGALKLLGDDLD